MIYKIMTIYVLLEHITDSVLYQHKEIDVVIKFAKNMIDNKSYSSLLIAECSETNTEWRFRHPVCKIYVDQFHIIPTVKYFDIETKN